MNKIRDEISYRVDLSEEEEKQLSLDPIDELFEELDDIGKKLDMYSIDWAFNYSHNKIEEVFEKEIKTKFVRLKDEKTEGKSIVNETNSMLHKIGASIAKTTKSFNGAQTATTVGEIIVSFVIIMLSHELTSYFVSHYAALISTTIIVAIFALFKIFIEKRYITKMNKKRQKRIYRNSLQKTRKAFIQMFIFYIKVNRFDEKHKDLNGENRHLKALEFIKENHPKLEDI